MKNFTLLLVIAASLTGCLKSQIVTPCPPAPPVDYLTQGVWIFVDDTTQKLAFSNNKVKFLKSDYTTSYSISGDIITIENFVNSTSKSSFVVTKDSLLMRNLENGYVSHFYSF